MGGSKLGTREGLKMGDVRACDLCGSPVSGNTRDGKAIDFRRITIDRFMLNPQALQREIGMQMVCGSAEMARVMGPNENIAELFTSREFLICNPCAYDEPLLGLISSGEESGKGRMTFPPEEQKNEEVR